MSHRLMLSVALAAAIVGFTGPAAAQTYTAQDLGILQFGTYSQGLAINASGQVAGWSGALSSTGQSVAHAVRWDADLTMHVLGLLPLGSYALPTDISDAG